MKKTLFGTSPKAQDLTPPEFVGLRGPLTQTLTDLIRSGGFPEFQGNFTAPLTGDETGTLAALNAAARGQGAAGEGTGAAQDLLTQTLRGDFLSPDSNPFLRSTIEAASRPILQQFEDELLNQRAQFTAGGQAVTQGASSPFALAEARRQTGLANALGDVGTNIAFGNLANERGLQNQAVQLQQQQQQAEVQNLLQTLEANALPRLIEQFGIDQGLAEFQRLQAQLLQLLGLTGNLAIGQQAILPGTQGIVQSFAQGAGQGVGQSVGASDRRLKADVRRIGTWLNGLPVYAFRYLGSVAEHVGFMADEVAELHPDAVGDLLGYQTVDYAKAVL